MFIRFQTWFWLSTRFRTAPSVLKLVGSITSIHLQWLGLERVAPLEPFHQQPKWLLLLLLWRGWVGDRGRIKQTGWHVYYPWKEEQTHSVCWHTRAAFTHALKSRRAVRENANVWVSCLGRFLELLLPGNVGNMSEWAHVRILRECEGTKLEKTEIIQISYGGKEVPYTEKRATKRSCWPKQSPVVFLISKRWTPENVQYQFSEFRPFYQQIFVALRSSFGRTCCAGPVSRKYPESISESSFYVTRLIALTGCRSMQLRIEALWSGNADNSPSESRMYWEVPDHIQMQHPADARLRPALSKVKKKIHLSTPLKLHK